MRRDNLEPNRMILNSKLIEIPMEWEIEIIGDVAKKQKGKKPENLFDTPGDNLLPYLTISASKGQVSQWSDKLDGKRVSDNQTLIVWDGASSGSVFKSSKGIVGSTLACLVFDEKQMDNEFAYYFLAHSKLQISSLVEGTGIPHVPRDFMDFFQILKPPLPEQRRIAEILSTVDELIQQTDAVIEETERLKRGLMQDLLTQGIGHESFRLEHLGPKAVEIPDPWRFERMVDVAKIVSGSTPKKNNSNYWGGKIYWATPTDVTGIEGTYLYKTEEKLTEAGLKNCSSDLLPPGSVLMTSRATIGEAVINRVPVATNQGFKSLIPNDDISSEYLYYFVRTIANYLREIGSGSTFPEISKPDMENIRVPVPHLAEQKKIASIINSAEKKRTDAIVQRNKLQNLKRGLMQDLLTGKVRVPVET